MAAQARRRDLTMALVMDRFQCERYGPVEISFRLSRTRARQRCLATRLRCGSVLDAAALAVLERTHKWSAKALRSVRGQGDALPETVPEFAARIVVESAANSSRPTHVYPDGGGTMTPILRHEANFPSDLKE
jgi:hypothetical protein